MTATIYSLPSPLDMAWLDIGGPLRSSVLEHTGSTEIADAVEARCRDAFERCFPNKSTKLVSAGATREEVSDVINSIIGRFVRELCQIAIDLELQKREGA